MKNIHNKLVSVALCTYNGEKYIDEQVQSILYQDYRPLEIVISDDNSTDGTWEILNEWKSKHPELIFISSNRVNIGYNKNFEKVITNCRGDFIAISDQDDIWMRDKISRLVNLLNMEGTILAQCQSLSFTDKTGVYKRGSLERQHTFNGNDVRQIAFFNRVEGHNMIFKRTLLEHILPFPSNTYYDWWIAAIATNYGNIATLDEYLVKHRIHEENHYYSLKRNKMEELIENLTFINALPLTQIKDPQAYQFLQEAKKVLEHKIGNNPGKFDYPFFRFLINNRQTIFGFKKRKSKLHKQWTMLKSAYKLANS